MTASTPLSRSLPVEPGSRPGPARPGRTRQPGQRPSLASLCFLGALMATLFAGHWQDLGVPLAPDRLLFPLGLLLILLDRRRLRPRAHPVYPAMIVFVWSACVSLILLGDPTDRTAVFALLDRVLMPLLLFAAAPLFLDTTAARRWLLRAGTVVGLYLVVVTLLETVGASGALWPRYIGADVLADAARMGDEARRAGGPFLHGEANGMALAMCGVLAILEARVERGAWFVLCASVGVLAPTASILSLTRSVWLGVVLAALLVVCAHRPLWRWAPAMLLAAVIALGIGAALFPQVVSGIEERGTTSRSLYDRANSNAAAVRALSEHPVTGVGWGRFVHLGPDYARQADDYPVTTVDIEVHNVVLSRAAELGVPAAALYCYILLAGLLIPLLRRGDRLQEWRLATLAIVVLWLVPAMVSPAPYTFPTFLCFTVAGWFFAARRDPRQDAGAPMATTGT